MNNHFFLLIGTAIFITTTSAMNAASALEQAFTEAQTAHEKAIIAATAAENQRYATSLQLLLQRANQNNDFETAAKIIEVLKTTESNKLSPDAIAVGRWRFTYNTGVKGTNELLPNHTFRGVPDMKVKGKWKIENDKLLFLFNDGGLEWFILPLDPKGTRGATRSATFVAIRE